MDQCIGLYPADLLSVPPLAVPTVDSIRRKWWLAHTRPRQEKSVAKALHSRHIAYYLPLIIRKSLLRGRARIARIPLFPSYIFVSGDEADRLSTLQTNRVVALHQAPDGEQLRKQLSTLAEFILAGV